MTADTKRHIASAALIIGFFLMWEFLCWAGKVSSVVLPRPSEVVATLVERRDAIWPHAWQTLFTTLIGFALGVGIGVLLGILIGASKLAYAVVYPLLSAFRAFRRSRWCRSSFYGSAPARCRPSSPP